MSQTSGSAVAPTARSEVVTQNARVAEMDTLAAEWLNQTRPLNTTRAYGQDWNLWVTYCDELQIPHVPATPGTLVGYIRWLVLRGAAPATINRRLTGAIVGHRERGIELPREVRKAGREALNAETRRLAKEAEDRGRGRARAIGVKELRIISAACPDDTAGKRDRSLVLIGFAIAARRSELANLLVRDIRQTEQGLLVRIRFGKGNSAREVAVPAGTHPDTCPAKAWREWLAVRVNPEPDQPAFLRVDRHGNMRGNLQPQGVGNVVTRVAQRAALDRTTAHGLRAGLATEARRAGHDAKTIAAQGGWSPSSSVLYDYMRIVDRWSDNAVAGTGL